MQMFTHGNQVGVMWIGAINFLVLFVQMFVMIWKAMTSKPISQTERQKCIKVMTLDAIGMAILALLYIFLYFSLEV